MTIKFIKKLFVAIIIIAIYLSLVTSIWYFCTNKDVVYLLGTLMIFIAAPAALIDLTIHKVS